MGSSRRRRTRSSCRSCSAAIYTITIRLLSELLHSYSDYHTFGYDYYTFYYYDYCTFYNYDYYTFYYGITKLPHTSQVLPDTTLNGQLEEAPYTKLMSVMQRGEPIYKITTRLI